MKYKLLILGLLFLCMTSYAQNHTFETVKNDPFNVKIYTLQNGMKVYMSVYKDVPKIQTYIAVRVGSKNDPKETTGLAHYLEHLMFKGTQQIGTLNWAEEEPLLQQIEEMFEVYRSETDLQKRMDYYHVIDSLSYLASTYAIPNEYVKMMKFLGSTGTNAWTSNDNTVYTEQIPANQLENWAMVQADRFQHPVIRLFHTELETVYEEKNRSLTSDSRKASEAMLAALFPHHPYGTQTTLGEAEHLKNPSIKNIRHFIETYYVPNNIAICLAGDFDPDEAVSIIEKYFGNWQPKDFPRLSPVVEPPFEQIETKTVTGLEAAFVTVAYRIGIPANHPDIYYLRMLDYLLNNGKTGLIDLNINQKNLTASASSYPYVLADNSAFVLTGKPKDGQTLEEVKDLLISQLDLIRRGEFDEELMQASLNNMRLSEMRQLESIDGRARQMLNAFTNALPWEEACHSVGIYSKITKQGMIDFVNRYFHDKYVVIYKEQGAPEEANNVQKPPITPIQINRDVESEFFKQLKNKKTASIDPVFVDFNKDIQHSDQYGMQVHTVQNIENETFNVFFRFNHVGELFDKRWPVATAVVPYLATANRSAEEVRRAFYRLACSISVSCSDDYIDVTLSGLAENFEEAFALMQEVLLTPKLTDEAFKGVVDKMMKNMTDAKASQNSVLNALRSYGEYGPALIAYSLKPDELAQLKGGEIVDLYATLTAYPFEVFYYGPLKHKQLINFLKKKMASKGEGVLGTETQERVFKNKEVVENQVLFIPYDAKQSRLVTYTRGPLFDSKLLPIITMYNAYFGGGMSAIVFQEMREKRSLAYTAKSAYIAPTEKDDYMYNYSFIGTQNDKVTDAWEAFNTLFNEMPLSEATFKLAQESVKNDISNTRYTKRGLLSFYIRNRERGFDYDYRRNIWNAVDGFTLQDVADFNKKYVQNQPKTYMILAREGEIDLKLLEEKFGQVVKLSLKDIFGF